MHVTSFVNHKGGVGKSTSAVSIAAVLAALGRRVLVIDMDPQGSATLLLGAKDDGSKLLHALQSTSALPVTQTGLPGLELVPAGPQLAEAGQRFTGAMAGELLSRCLRASPTDWDHIFIDCPPSLGALTLNALRASDDVIIPVETNHLALSGLHQMIEAVESVQSRNAKLKIAALLPCRIHPRRRIHKEILQRLEQLFPGRVAPAIRENAAVAEAAGKGTPVGLFAPRAAGAEDYRAAAEWLGQHLANP